MGIRLYCGVSETKWNYEQTNPGQYTCISPVYGKSKQTHKETAVVIPKTTIVIQDSGAFSDNNNGRLSIERALERQQKHSEKYNYTSQLTHRASYDLLIDETWIDDIRYKKRWSYEDAQLAVDETVNAAKYISKNRDTFGVILSAQGVEPKQYLNCSLRVLEYFDNNTDIFGLGGWCILGKMRSLLPSYEETIKLVIPELAKRGVKNVHIWGVLYSSALGKLLHLCNQHDIKLSTDSVGPSIRPCFGVWGYAEWFDKTYVRKPVEKRGLDRILHVEKTRLWLDNFENTKHYVSVQ